MKPISMLPAIEPCRHEAEPCRHETELAQAQTKIANLEIALTTRQQIGTAVGIIMATYKLSQQEAFDLLVVASQNTHRKLRDVAQDVVDTGALNTAPRVQKHA